MNTNISKYLVKYEFDCDNISRSVLRRANAMMMEIVKRLFFLKKFKFPMGCINDAFSPWCESFTVETRINGLRRTILHKFNGIVFMREIEKPRKQGWQIELIYID